MIEFLTNNWKVIAILAAIVIEIIVVLFFKKRPTIVDTSLVSKVAQWIQEAEQLYSVGSDKLNYVLMKARVHLGELFDENSITKLVEWLLTLPQKKEVKKHEK